MVIAGHGDIMKRYGVHVVIGEILWVSARVICRQRSVRKLKQMTGIAFGYGGQKPCHFVIVSTAGSIRIRRSPRRHSWLRWLRGTCECLACSIHEQVVGFF